MRRPARRPFPAPRAAFATRDSRTLESLVCRLAAVATRIGSAEPISAPCSQRAVTPVITASFGSTSTAAAARSVSVGSAGPKTYTPRTSRRNRGLSSLPRRHPVPPSTPHCDQPRKLPHPRTFRPNPAVRHPTTRICGQPPSTASPFRRDQAASPTWIRSHLGGRECRAGRRARLGFVPSDACPRALSTFRLCPSTGSRERTRCSRERWWITLPSQTGSGCAAEGSAVGAGVEDVEAVGEEGEVERGVGLGLERGLDLGLDQLTAQLEGQ